MREMVNRGRKYRRFNAIAILRWREVDSPFPGFLDGHVPSVGPARPGRVKHELVRVNSVVRGPQRTEINRPSHTVAGRARFPVSTGFPPGRGERPGPHRGSSGNLADIKTLSAWCGTVSRILHPCSRSTLSRTRRALRDRRGGGYLRSPVPGARTARCSRWLCLVWWSGSRGLSLCLRFSRGPSGSETATAPSPGLSQSTCCGRLMGGPLSLCLSSGQMGGFWVSHPLVKAARSPSPGWHGRCSRRDAWSIRCRFPRTSRPPGSLPAESTRRASRTPPCSRPDSRSLHRPGG